MSETPWSIAFTRRADKDMERLDRPVRLRVVRALDTLAGDAHSGKLLKLSGRPESRLRVGDTPCELLRSPPGHCGPPSGGSLLACSIRKIEERTRTVEVQRVLPRGGAYKR